MSLPLEDLSRTLAALADPARLRLLALCGRGELSVQELTAATGMSQPRVSRHLRILQAAGLLRRFREQHWVYYRLRTEGEAARLAAAALGALSGWDGPLREDARRLDQVLAARAREARAAAGGDSESVLTPPAWAELERAVRDLAGERDLGQLLDVGTGAGRLLGLLAPRARRAIGVDNQRPMRIAARHALQAAGLTHCTVRDADMYALPYADGQFDTVSLGRVLTGAQRPWDVIGEAARVLRPDGALLIVDLLPDGMPVDAWCQSLGDWLAAAGIEGTAPHRLVLPGCTGILHRGRATAARVTAA